MEKSILGEPVTTYSLDEGKTWNVYEKPILFKKQGQYRVWYSSVDGSGSVERAKLITFQIVGE
ncbi:hypothetical protein D3C81_2250210 [compost metagenome]